MMFFRSLGSRMALAMMLLSGIMLVVGYLWLEQHNQSLAIKAESARAELAAESLVASLKSIMLAGHGDIAHDWLKRVSGISDFTSANVYRVDGVEAFQDQKTIHKVNQWLAETRFHRPSTGVIPGKISPDLVQAFSSVVRGHTDKQRVNHGTSMTYLYPIKVEDACLQCHGYTKNPLRGVLALGISTAQAQSRASAFGTSMLALFFFMAILLGLGAWLIVRYTVLAPLNVLADAAEHIRAGDLTYPVSMKRKDELGSLSRVLDNLVAHLRDHIHHQQGLTQAVASLSSELVSEQLLKHVGRLAQEMTHARYVMLSYIKDGEKQFIPLGLTDDEAKRLAPHPPQGTGLLGLLWKNKQVLRIENMADHPMSAGFPEAHPPMHSLLGIPILFRDEVVGVIYLTDKQNHEAFTEQDEEVIRVLASACGVALSNAHNFEALEDVNASLERRVNERTKALKNINNTLRNREVELELINEELAAANTAKDQFIANTSHELRTPLNAIIGFSELLALPKAGALSTKQLRYTQHINESGKRLLHVINDLLDISKIEAGMMDIQETAFYPDHLVQRVAEELTPIAGQKSLTLEWIPGEHAHTELLADEDKLQHILVNLAGNALKFTPENGRVTIEVDVVQERDGSGIVVHVRDTGIGIAPEDVARVFEPFVQAEGGLDRKHGGTGLGLALCRRLANMLGGGIDLVSELGVGSCFTVRVPARFADAERDAHVADIDATPPVQDEAVSTDHDVQEFMPADDVHPRVLIFDDDTQRVTTMLKMLEEDDYQGIEVDGENIAESIETECPFMIMIGTISDDMEQTHQRLKMVKHCDGIGDIPVVLLGGDAHQPTFATGAIDSVDHQLGHHELMDMVARHGRFLPTQPSMRTILVIDDDASVRAYLKESLVMEGYRILLASDGAEGLRLATEREPDLIILDMMMPGMTGFDVMEQLRSHPTARDIPVVVYTAKDLTKGDLLRLGRGSERVLIKGATGRSGLVQELRKMELLYPVQARLVDPELKCFNRRYLDLRLNQEAERAQRYNQQFSLIGWRIDAFDEYLQAHGKRWGLAALKDISALARTVTRRADILTRMGENEFTLILPGISPLGAQRVAEKLRIRIQQHAFPLPGGIKGRLTASFAAVHFDIADDKNGVDLLEVLATRMSEAVRAGGNCGMLGEME